MMEVPRSMGAIGPSRRASHPPPKRTKPFAEACRIHPPRKADLCSRQDQNFGPHSASAPLRAERNFEPKITTTTSVGNITLTGGRSNDTFITASGTDVLDGGAGNDLLNGGSGADRLIGGSGNDTFVVDNNGDRAIEAVGGGTDRVLSSISYKLTAGQEIEALQLLSSTGKARLHLEGNEFGQTLVGNKGANTLNGGLGNDVLIGGGGADTFIFAAAPGSNNIDRIGDFAPEDTIRLSKSVFAALAPGPLAEAAFKDIGTTKLDAGDRILYDSRNGNLFYDADGSGKGLAVKVAVLDNKVALTATDILVV